MDGELILVGISHRTASLALRERFAIPKRDLPSALTALQQTSTAREAVILSTCNRFECYLVADEATSAIEGTLDLFSHHSRLNPEAFRAHVQTATGPQAIRHLCRVAAGLDSAILGESEITAQIKDAYALAAGCGMTGPVLNPLFQKALHAAKEVRRRTAISQGNASIGSVVTSLIRSVFGASLASRDVLLWGAGKAAEATARHLIKQGVRQLWIVNRTPVKAQDLASLCRSGWLSWEQALAHLAHVDIAIVCTQAPHYVIDEADIASIRSQRHGRSLCLIDLAVPRNIDPAVTRHSGTHLYNIDDLQAVAQESLAWRRAALTHCDAIIEAQAAHMLRRCAGSVQPLKEVVTC